MSTATYQRAQERATDREQVRAALAMTKMTADDFRVCEGCGGPAVVHPRFEMAQIVAGSKAILCCECLHEAAFPAPPIRKLGEMRHGDQLWKCDNCRETRAWGIAQPWDSTLRALLGCGNCGHATRHRFAGIFGWRR